jgi:WhiB family redox-sensing transcriptional regulator
MERTFSSGLRHNKLDLNFARAKCKDYKDPDFFFNTVTTRGREEIADDQKDFCLGCPIIEQCLDYALHVDVVGVWGGTSYQDRRRIRKRFNIIAEPLAFGLISGGTVEGRTENARRTA